MAKIKAKFPLDGIGGTIEGPDRTIGRDKGMASSLRVINTAVAGDKNNQGKIQLYATKAPTRGGSVARHSRAQRYCFCDEGYQMLGYPKMSFLQPWWRAIRELPNAPISPYHIFMKICLKYMPEMAAFQHFSYCSRYFIKNRSLVAWVNFDITLATIPVYQADGQDLEVYSLLNIATKKGRITYDRLMIDKRLIHNVTVPGCAVVTIPSLAPGASCLIDIYSYYPGV